MMRGYLKKTPDSPAELAIMPQPTPQKGQILVRIFACGLNHADLLMLKGTYQDTPTTPFCPGMEVCGVVDSLGPNTTGPKPGTRIAVFGGYGGLAEYGCFPAEACVPIPDTMSNVEAAAFIVGYGTSHVALTHTTQITPGERLLVLGAAGGVGLTAVEIGAAMGAEVIACARGPEKLAVAKAAGAHHLIDSETQDIRETVKALGGADIVYDAVGGDQFTAALRATNTDGRVLVIGFASGDIPQIKANHILVKNISVRGLYWGGYLRTKPQVVTNSLAQLFQMQAQGKLRPHVSHVLPLAQTGEALEILRTRRSTGKVVVTMT